MVTEETLIVPEQPCLFAGIRGLVLLPAFERDSNCQNQMNLLFDV